MDFFIPDNIVFSISNEIKPFEFTRIKKFKEYKVNFISNFNINSEIHIKIKQFYSNSTIKESLLFCNNSITFSNYYLTKLSFEFINCDFYTDEANFKLEIIEMKKIFDLESNKNLKKIDNFVNLIKNQNHINYNKSFPNIKIASILDEFSFDCFSMDANLINLSYNNCIDEVKNFNPDFLFVESIWRGKDNTWENKIATTNDYIDFQLLNLIYYCNDNNIPTVFWNKEGLVNLKYFDLVSSIFDYVFVTDENIIKKTLYSYKSKNINILEFAAQPKLHNSIGKNNYKLGSIAFAGSWYGNIHKSRILDIENILKPSLEFNLDIFDRNFKSKDKLTYLNIYWPDEYLNNIVGSLDYKFLVYTYKNYELFLNINSIVNSKYMISRRVYEILCSKTPVLSSPCKYIENHLFDKVFVSNSNTETKFILNYILNNKFNIRKLSKKNQRFILEEHTYENRLEHIFSILNIKYSKDKPLKVFIIGICETYNSFFNLYSNIKNQTYKHIDYVIFASSRLFKDINILNIDNLNIIYFDFSKNNNFNELIKNIILINKEINYFAVFNSKYIYCENYIRDYINTLSFAKTSIIGKNKILISFSKKNKPKYLKCNKFNDSYTSSIFLFTSFIEKNIFEKIFFSIDFLQCNILYNKNNNINIYSDDEFNFAVSKNLLNYIRI